MRLILLISIYVVWTTHATKHGPRRSLDVIVLLDSSDGFRSEDFGIEKFFALDLLELFWEGNTRMGFYTFGGTTQKEFALDEHPDLDELASAISEMTYSTGNGTSLVDAMVTTLERGFLESEGGRTCTPNVLVVLTHTGIRVARNMATLREYLRTNAVNLVVFDMVEEGSGFNETVEERTTVYRCREIHDLRSRQEELLDYVKEYNFTNDCGILTEWSPWSRCTASCGPGQRLRMRKCIVDENIYVGCPGALSEDKPCYLGQCTEPVNGEWSVWETWSKCSKTCGKGTQSRKRSCDDPPPAYGGNPCQGPNNQTRQCADWKCPDCNRQCPPGGRLSADCETCECVNVTLFGKVKDSLDIVVENASVFLESCPYKSLGETGKTGLFSVAGTCIMDEQVLIGKPGYSRQLVLPLEFNTSHWRADAIISKQIAPLFSVAPSTKVRLVGQSASLCCAAAGVPMPEVYKWYKDDIEIEGQGTDGVLELVDLSVSDSGRYHCSSETEAGVSLSSAALLTVRGQDTDTCGGPSPKYHTLPPTCFVADDYLQNNTINVGTCAKSNCITTAHVDNGTCTDWWPHHCCDVGETERINITCDSFNYEETRIKTCKCRLCISKTTISGRAYGKQNGKITPLQLGVITLNGQEVSRTTMSGGFRFDVPRDVKRAVLHFSDIVFNKFFDHVKIVTVNDGFDTQILVVIPIKPKPIPCNPNIGLDIPLGSGQEKGIPPLSTISIPENSIITRDGESYTGPADVTVHFMDPRNRDDLEMANGDFVYENPNGQTAPLETYGIIQIGLTDENGNGLLTNKPLQINFDSSLVNISLDENGDPDLGLWYYDDNKGVWIEQSKLRFSSAGGGQRRLLANQLVGQVIPPNIPAMDPNSYSDVTETKYRNELKTVRVEINKFNFDKIVQVRSVPYNVTRRVKRTKENVCYVCVAAYTDLTLREPAEGGSVAITAYSQETGNNGKYLGVQTQTVNENGEACLLVFCNNFVYLQAQKDGVNLFPATGRHELPEIFSPESSKPKEVKFVSRFYGRALDCGNKPCSGPMYLYEEGKGEIKCRQRRSDSTSYRFKFAPSTKEPKLTLKCGSPNVHDEKLSWYPNRPDKNQYRACYIKIQVKVQGAFELRVIAKSYLKGAERETFGDHDVGPVPNPESGDMSNRAACVEFRCPGYVKDGSQENFNLPTLVQGRLLVWNETNRRLRCNANYDTSLKINVEPDQKGFTFEAEPGNNYGSDFGVFIGDVEANRARDYCYSGLMSGPTVGGLMEPDINPAIVFDCSFISSD